MMGHQQASPSSRTRILAAVLGLGALGLVADRVFFLEPRAASASTEGPSPAALATTTNQSPHAEDDREPLASTFRAAMQLAVIPDGPAADAFSPLQTAAVIGPDSHADPIPFIACTMVVRDASGGIAVINDNPTRPGQTVDGVTLLRIEARHIVVEHMGRELDIPIGDPDPTPSGINGRTGPAGNAPQPRLPAAPPA